MGDVFYGAGRGSRTPISTLARWHNSRYTIPATSWSLRAIRYQFLHMLTNPLGLGRHPGLTGLKCRPARLPIAPESVPTRPESRAISRPNHEGRSPIQNPMSHLPKPTARLGIFLAQLSNPLRLELQML